MANKFTITIDAVDKATKVVNKVNKSVGSIFRPYENAKKSLKSFTDAIGRNDFIRRPLGALDVLGKGVTTFGQSFGMAENSVLGATARVAAALGSFGGPVGGFLAGTAAIVGGTTAVGVKMGQLGFDIERTARSLNISTGQLQEYRAAAKLAGLETGAMDSSLKSLGQVLQEADFGRDPMAAEALKRMGISIKRTKDGAVDTVQAFRDVADVVSHMRDQNMARKLTDMLGITEMLPLLREGTAKLDEFIGKARATGNVMSDELVKRNKQQADAWNETKTSIDGAATSVGNLIAQYTHLNTLAATVSKTAELLQRKQADSSGESVPFWRRLLQFNAFSLGGLSADAAREYLKVPEGPRSSSGAVGGSGGGLPLGLRNNNPGNIKSPSGGFSVFSSPEAGIGAMARNLMAYQDRHGINSISGIVNRWAPGSDGNNVGSYIADMARQTGYGPNQALNLHDPQVLAPLISAITRHENGQNPYSPEMISQAVSAALRDAGERPINLTVQNVPAGLTIKPVRGLGQSSVGLTMAPGGMS